MDSLYHKIWTLSKVPGIRYSVMVSTKSKIAKIRKDCGFVSGKIPVLIHNPFDSRMEYVDGKAFKWFPKWNHWRYKNLLGMWFVIWDK